MIEIPLDEKGQYSAELLEVYARAYRRGYSAGARAAMEGELWQAEDKGILDLPLEELDLSNRTQNVLRFRGATTLGDLLNLTEQDILCTRNLGQKSIQEVAGLLHRMGIYCTGWDQYSPE